MQVCSLLLTFFIIISLFLFKFKIIILIILSILFILISNTTLESIFDSISIEKQRSNKGLLKYFTIFTNKV